MGILRKAGKVKEKVDACLRDEACTLVLRAAMEAPGVHADKLDVAVAERLAADGILTIEREGGVDRYYVTAEARALLIDRMPLHYQCPGLKRE